MKLLRATVLCLIGACTPVSPYIRAYHGVVQPSEEVGLVRVSNSNQAQVTAINGERYASLPNEGDAYIALRPGDHTITVTLNPRSGQATRDLQVRANIQRMRNYALEISDVGSPSARAEIVDVTDKPGQWCLSCYLEPAMPTGTIADP
jgi:hypothetical protein